MTRQYQCVDAYETRLHISTCIGAGMSLRAIAGASGLSANLVSKIHGGQRFIHRTSAEAILAVQPGITRDASAQTTEPFVPKVGAVRRLQALHALGWPHTELSPRAGLLTKNIGAQQGRWITLSTFEAIERLYDELSMTPGPSPRTRGWARKLGYAPPLAWDDIDTDETPSFGQVVPYTRDPYLDEVAITRRLEGDRTIRLTTAETKEAVRRWFETGRSGSDLYSIAGIKAERHYKVREAAA